MKVIRMKKKFTVPCKELRKKPGLIREEVEGDEIIFYFSDDYISPKAGETYDHPKFGKVKCKYDNELNCLCWYDFNVSVESEDGMRRAGIQTFKRLGRCDDYPIGTGALSENSTTR